MEDEDDHTIHINFPYAPPRNPNHIASDRHPDFKPLKLCTNCGFTTNFLVHSSYVSSLEIIHALSRNGVWSIGNDWLLKDTPNDGRQGWDYITQEFIRKSGVNIPLVPEMKLLTTPEDKRHIVLMRRVPGVPLSQIADTISDEEIAQYAKEVVQYINEIRKIPAPNDRMGAVDGSNLRDLVFGPHMESCYYDQSKWIYLGAHREDWVAALLPVVERKASKLSKDPEVRAAFVEDFKKRIPPCKPYKLTHGDLNPENIMVHEGHVSGIIDWELGGFYPYWTEWAQINIVKHPRWFCALAAVARDSYAFPKDTRGLNDTLDTWESYFLGDEWEESDIVYKEPVPFCACRPYIRP